MKKIFASVTLVTMCLVANDYRHEFMEHIEFSSLKDGDKREVECLAKNMYHEARGESYQGIVAVAFVTLNRTVSEVFPSKVCDVVYQKNRRGCQFSWVCARTVHSSDLYLYDKIRAIAANIYIHKDKILDPSDGALFYHAKYVKPEWRKSMTVTTEIGQHVFYKLGE